MEDRKLPYRDFFNNIIKNINGELDDISSRYNFDYGDEFEIAICEILSEVLPEKYGICRGFVVTKDGDFAGDDIIIYDKDRFPTLRMLKRKSFYKKQDIPIEAVYAYIEAKNTIYTDNSKETKGQSFEKSISQLSKVKEVVSKRSSVDFQSIDPYTRLEDTFTVGRERWHDIKNPIFGGVIARQIKKNSHSEATNVDILNAIKSSKDKGNYRPDLFVIGNEYIVIPLAKEGEKTGFSSPFFVEGKSKYALLKLKDTSFAVGIIILLFALDTINLGFMPYRDMIINSLITTNISNTE